MSSPKATQKNRIRRRENLRPEALESRRLFAADGFWALEPGEDPVGDQPAEISVQNASQQADDIPTESMSLNFAKVTYNDYNFVRGADDAWIDAVSQDVAETRTNGDQIAGQKVVPYYKITFSDVLISSYQSSGSA